MITPRWARVRKAEERNFYAEMRAWLRRPQRIILGSATGDLAPYVKGMDRAWRVSE